MWDIAILSGARTPFAAWAGGRKPDGARGGALKDADAFDMGAVAVKGALERSGLQPEEIDALAFGNVYPTGPENVYGARYVGLRAGLPESVPAVTPNMACGTGLYALAAAAGELARGAARVVAGGAESISHVRKEFLLRSFQDTAAGGAIGEWVAGLAREAGVSRENQDRWAEGSHRRAARARAAGLTAAEIVPACGTAADDTVRTEPKPEDFAAAKELYPGGVTRLNSHAIVDGAAALVLASAEAAASAPRRPLGRLRAAASAGVAPRRMGVASVPAIQKLLAGAGLAARDVDLFEINETFAAQTLLDARALGVPEEKLNVNGGAVALGHPFAASGCRQVLALLLELARRRGRWGVASICAGGGQGIAVLVENA